MAYCGCLLMSTIHLSQFSVRERDSRPKSQEIGIRDTWWLLARLFPAREGLSSLSTLLWKHEIIRAPVSEPKRLPAPSLWGLGLIEPGETINIQTTVKYLNSTLQLEWINKNVAEYLLPKTQGKGHRHQTVYLKMVHWCILGYELFCH